MTMTREELQRLYDDCQDGRYGHLVALVAGARRFLAEPDPTVEIAYLKAALADAQTDTSRVPGMLSMKWDGGRCAVLNSDRRIVGYLPPGRQAAGAAASALREAADDAEGDEHHIIVNRFRNSYVNWLRERADRIESGAES